MKNEEVLSETKFNKYIKILVVLMGGLAVLRLLQLDIWSMISDALAALMIYFFLLGKGKCMALFLLLNSIMGIFISLSRLGQFSKNPNYASFEFFVIFYSLIAYGFECGIAASGIYRYSWENMFGSGNGVGINPPQSNNQNYGTLASSDEGQSSKFKAFSGRGTTLGV